MKYIHSENDSWASAPADEAAPQPQPKCLLTLAQWQAVREQWPADLQAGLLLPNDADVEDIAADLPRLALVALHFPKWTDGRAYSQARVLRSRYRFAGELRATGDVVVDMIPLLDRTGFDTALLRAGQDETIAERQLKGFAAYYQGDVHDNHPLFARASGQSPSV
jgi:uncharacterized protein (DUF934 family)